MSVGVAAHTAPRLHTVQVDGAITALRALIEHREDLVRSRTQTNNRLHALVTKLVPAGLPRKLTADAAAAALRTVRPRAPLGRTLRALAVELVAEVRRLDLCRAKTVNADVELRLRGAIRQLCGTR